MTTHVTTRNPVRSDLDHDAEPAATPLRTAARPGRAWAVAGIGTAVATLAAGVATGLINAVYDQSLNGDAPGILARLGDFEVQIVAFQVLSTLAALGLGVFGLGLARRLRATAPAGSLAPSLAAFGLLATSVVMVMGGALNTEFLFAVANPETVVPEAAVFYNHWIGTVPGCWLLVGLSALAVHSVARRGGAPRWLGRVGLVLGGLTVLVGVLPVQYMAGATGALWLLVTGIGFAVGDKQFRRA